MKQFCIPSSTEEIVTTTPVTAKSLRGLYFVVKNFDVFKLRDSQPRITITVDSKTIMQSAFVFPFCVQHPDNANYEPHYTLDGYRRLPDYDYRECMLRANLNVNRSEVKISGFGATDNEIDIVMLYSDTEVEQEEVEYVECLPIYVTTSGSDRYDNDIARVFSTHLHTQAPVTYETDEIPERVFAMPFDVRTHKAYNLAALSVSGSIEIGINQPSDAMPRWTIDLISPWLKIPWREVDWTFQDLNTSVLKITCEKASADTGVVLFFIHTKKY